MRGNRVRSNGAGVLLGEEDTPPPSMFGTTMKYLSGFKARSLPIRAASAPLWSPLNQVGETMTLSRLGERVPQVLNPSSASGSAPPFWRAKFFAEKNSSSPMRLSCFGINSSKTHAIGCLFVRLPSERACRPSRPGNLIQVAVTQINELAYGLS